LVVNIATMVDAMTPYQALLAARDAAGSNAALARICEVSGTAVWKWIQSSKRLPAEQVLKVEAATGVSRHLLRPDIYPIDHSTFPTDPEPPTDCAPIMSARSFGRQSNRQPVLDGSAVA